MNAKIIAGLTAASAVALTSFANPAQAFTFGTSGIQFDKDTTVDFGFVESHGAFTSALNIFKADNLTQSLATLFWETKQSDNGNANEWKGSFGNAVASTSGSNPISFTFKAGVAYTLGLLSGNNGSVYSTSALNTGSGGSQQAVFGAADTLASSLNKDTTDNFQAAGQFTAANPFAAPVMVSFDDRGNGNDADFQDFTITASIRGAEAVPEPLTMGGIALAGAGLAYTRRLRKQNNA